MIGGLFSRANLPDRGERIIQSCQILHSKPPHLKLLINIKSDALRRRILKSVKSNLTIHVTLSRKESWLLPSPNRNKKGIKMKRLFGIIAVALPLQLLAQNTVPIEVHVDTGSHTCTSIGQDHKVYQTITAGAGRYFQNPALNTHSNFGPGNCTYETDGGGPAQVWQKFKLIDADGEEEEQDRLVQVTVRAYSDCTNSPARLTTRTARDCKFTATSKKGKQ